MSDEEDIGLFNLARKSDSSAETPRKRNPRRPSIVTILHGEEKTPIKSPSSHNLPLPSSPNVTPRKLSRSNTLPKLSRTESSATIDDFGNLTMDSHKVRGLRRWILSVILGTLYLGYARVSISNILCNLVDFDLDYGPKITSVYPPLELTDSETENM